MTAQGPKTHRARARAGHAHAQGTRSWPIYEGVRKVATGSTLRQPPPGCNPERPIRGNPQGHPRRLANRATTSMSISRPIRGASAATAGLRTIAWFREDHVGQRNFCSKGDADVQIHRPGSAFLASYPRSCNLTAAHPPTYPMLRRPVPGCSTYLCEEKSKWLGWKGRIVNYTEFVSAQQNHDWQKNTNMSVSGLSCLQTGTTCWTDSDLEKAIRNPKAIVQGSAWSENHPRDRYATGGIT